MSASSVLARPQLPGVEESEDLCLHLTHPSLTNQPTDDNANRTRYLIDPTLPAAPRKLLEIVLASIYFSRYQDTRGLIDKFASDSAH